MKLTNNYVKHRDDWYTWTMSISGSNEELAQIEYVTYFLHPTFPTSELVSTNIANNFARNLEGWGEFLLRAEATMKDRTKKHASLWIDLGFENTKSKKMDYTGEFKDSS